MLAEKFGAKLELFVIDFQKDKMRLKVPVAKATSIGMRKLSEEDYVERALKADNPLPFSRGNSPERIDEVAGPRERPSRGRRRSGFWSPGGV